MDDGELPGFLEVSFDPTPGADNTIRLTVHEARLWDDIAAAAYKRLFAGVMRPPASSRQLPTAGARPHRSADRRFGMAENCRQRGKSSHHILEGWLIRSACSRCFCRSGSQIKTRHGPSPLVRRAHLTGNAGVDRISTLAVPRLVQLFRSTPDPNPEGRPWWAGLRCFWATAMRRGHTLTISGRTYGVNTSGGLRPMMGTNLSPRSGSAVAVLSRPQMPSRSSP